MIDYLYILFVGVESHTIAISPAFFEQGRILYGSSQSEQLNSYRFGVQMWKDGVRNINNNISKSAVLSNNLV